MAATGETPQPGLSRPPVAWSASGVSKDVRLPYGWPLYALFLGFPLWWFLGLGAFVWPVFAVPMLFSLVARARVKVPKGFGLYILFVIWMCASALMINGPDRMIGFVYRSSLYMAAGIICLYIYNAPKSLMPTARSSRRCSGSGASWWPAACSGC